MSIVDWTKILPINCNNLSIDLLINKATKSLLYVSGSVPGQFFAQWLHNHNIEMVKMFDLLHAAMLCNHSKLMQLLSLSSTVVCLSLLLSCS